MKHINENHWAFVESKLLQMQAQRKRLHDSVELLMLHPESPVYESQHILEQALIDSLEQLIGDANQTIDWFVHETNFGEKAMEAGFQDDMRTINTFEQLRWLIEATRSPDSTDA